MSAPPPLSFDGPWRSETLSRMLLLLDSPAGRPWCLTDRTGESALCVCPSDGDRALCFLCEAERYIGLCHHLSQARQMSVNRSLEELRDAHEKFEAGKKTAAYLKRNSGLESVPGQSPPCPIAMSLRRLMAEIVAAAAQPPTRSVPAPAAAIPSRPSCPERSPLSTSPAPRSTVRPAPASAPALPIREDPRLPEASRPEGAAPDRRVCLLSADGAPLAFRHILSYNQLYCPTKVKPGFFRTKESRAFSLAFRVHLFKLRKKGLLPSEPVRPLSVRITLFNSSIDADNCVKPILDTLKEGKVFTDDRYITELHVSRRPAVRGEKPGLLVEFEY